MTAFKFMPDFIQDLMARQDTSLLSVIDQIPDTPVMDGNYSTYMNDLPLDIRQDQLLRLLLNRLCCDDWDAEEELEEALEATYQDGTYALDWYVEAAKRGGVPTDPEDLAKVKFILAADYEGWLVPGQDREERNFFDQATIRNPVPRTLPQKTAIGPRRNWFNKCGSCGLLWPKFFRVSNEDWTRYTPAHLRKEIVCWECWEPFIWNSAEPHAKKTPAHDNRGTL